MTLPFPSYSGTSCERENALTRTTLPVVLLASILLFISCGGGMDGDTWLIRQGEQTITVASAGEAWIALTPDEKGYFLSRSNQFGEFIVSLARREMIVSEIERLGYMDRNDVLYTGEAWMRRASFSRGGEYIDSVVEASITEEDIVYFMDHMGKTVWFTLSPGTPDETSKGPDHLPELRRELAIHLDSMQVGEVLEMSDGVPVMLDSVYMTAPELIEASLEDTAAVTTYASQKLLTTWSSALRRSVTDSVIAAADPDIRTDALMRLACFYSGNGQLQPDDTLIVSALGTMTAESFVYEIKIMETGVPVQPSDSVWLMWLAKQTVSHEAFMEYLSTVTPETLEDLLPLRHEFMLETAFEQLYTDSVSSLIEITHDMLSNEYDSLNELPVIPESRSIQCVEVLGSALDEYRSALLSGKVDSFILECGFWPSLSQDSSPTFNTRPLLAEEIPGGNHNAVFSLERHDTTEWSDPLPLVEDFSYFAFRLRGVYPPHEASFEEMEGELELIIRTRLEEERLNYWLLDLEKTYDLRINEEVLSSLPSDPALWKDL